MKPPGLLLHGVTGLPARLMAPGVDNSFQSGDEGVSVENDDLHPGLPRRKRGGPFVSCVVYCMAIICLAGPFPEPELWRPDEMTGEVSCALRCPVAGGPQVRRRLVENLGN